MSHVRFVKIAAIAALFAVAGTASAGDNLVKNGDFSKTKDVIVPTNGYVVVDAGSDALKDWTVGEQSVDIVHGAYNAIKGNSIDMIGTPGPGELSQKIDGLSANTTYTLTFDLARNPYAASAAVTVDFLGQSATFAAPSGNGYTAETWTLSSNNLSGSSKLKFFSVNEGDNYSGAILDNVSLTAVTAAVPEPETYAMLLGGLGLLGFVARRRKQA